MTPVDAEPLVTIITVVRNAAATLPATLDSVAAQSFRDFEYIVQDGASTDGTREMLAASDVVTDWCSEPDAGVFDAMNRAVRRARGRWILFLGADDLLRDVLGELAPQLVDAKTVYYGDVELASTGARYDGAFGAFKLAGRNICHQAIFYPRAVFARHRYDTTYPRQADWVLNMACWRDATFAFRYLPFVISRYNDVDGMSSREPDRMLEQDYPALLRRHFPAWIAAWYTALVLGGRLLRRTGVWS